MFFTTQREGAFNGGSAPANLFQSSANKLKAAYSYLLCRINLVKIYLSGSTASINKLRGKSEGTICTTIKQQ